MTQSELTPAVAYYRMSTDRQEESITDQRAAVIRYAKANGYQILREYCDEGVSGDATEKRHQFKRMIADSEHGDFVAILCWDMDRFGRFDSIEAGRWVYPLRQNGVRLVTVAQGALDWSDFAGRMMYGIQTEAKHQYLRDLSRNVTRGMTRLAEQGKWSGAAPIGYRVVDKQLAVGSPDDVELVRWMFREYAFGQSLRGLASKLNVERRLSPKGKLWTANGIAGVLKNRVYIGDFVWNQRCLSKYKRNGRRTKINQESEWIVFENHHEPIVERSHFDLVQSQLKRRRTASTPVKSGGGFLLSGLLVCAKCGHKMWGDLANGVHQYSCYGYRQHGSSYCDRNALRQKDILDALLAASEEKLFNAAVLKRLADECRRQLRGRLDKPQSRRIERELGAIDGRLAKAKRRLIEVDADLIADVQDEVRTLKAERARLESMKRPATAPSDRTLEETVSRALEWFASLKEAAGEGNNTLVREFLVGLFERIEVTADKIPWTSKRFKYRLKAGTATLQSNNLLGSVHQFLQVTAIEFAA